MRKFIDLTGKVFGRLKAIYREAGTKAIPAKWICYCACGNTCKTTASNLRDGTTKSCGCLYKETRKNGRIHGKYGYPENAVWGSMKQRCNNPSDKKYKIYGDRGISVCSRWEKSFLAFLDDMGRRPTKRHTIERMDTNGNYEPSNCKWATYTEQNNNTSRNRFICYKGKTQTIAQWCRELGIPYGTINSRIHKGWDAVNAFTTPIRHRARKATH